jgi:hypothetical protein
VSEERRIKAPCSYCARHTSQTVLCEAHGPWEEDEKAPEGGYYSDLNQMIRCDGCLNISFRVTDLFPFSRDDAVTYYPPPITRREPPWLLDLILYSELGGNVIRLHTVLREIYSCIRGGELFLASLGIRALIEMVMLIEVSDTGTFRGNLDEFERNGYISKVQRGSLDNILEAGHGAMHPSHMLEAKELHVCLDIIEGVMGAIHVHQKKSAEIRARVPERSGRNKKK